MTLITSCLSLCFSAQNQCCCMWTTLISLVEHGTPFKSQLVRNFTESYHFQIAYWIDIASAVNLRSFFLEKAHQAFKHSLVPFIYCYYMNMLYNAIGHRGYFVINASGGVLCNIHIPHRKTFYLHKGPHLINCLGATYIYCLLTFFLLDNSSTNKFFKRILWMV